MSSNLACKETIWEEEEDDGCSLDSGLAASNSSSDCNDDLTFDGIRSVLDRSLVADVRVLENVLTDASVAVSYFGTVQTEIKPHMRKIVAEWMLEVCPKVVCF
jgi:hypothetical protein